MTQKKNGDIEGKTPEYYLNLIFEKFEAQEERLTETGKEAVEQMNVMLKLIRDKGIAIFDNEKDLYIGLDGFKSVIGHTDHLVIYIELQHKKLSQPEALAEQAFKQASVQAQQQQFIPRLQAITNQPEDERRDYGFWHFMGERRRAIALERVLSDSKQTQMMTTERQIDFMNYAKDIPPELNRIYAWLGGTLLRIRRFKECETTKTVCYSQLRTHLEKLATQTVGFSNATIELRKELVGEREVAYAQAMSIIEQVRLMAQAGPSGAIQVDTLNKLWNQQRP